MTLDSGKLEVYRAVTAPPDGLAPKQTLTLHTYHYYQNRTVSFRRQYAAMGAGQQVDRLIRIWRDETLEIGMVAVLEDKQYRIDNIQHMDSEDGLPVTDLTLSRLEDYYDIAGNS